MQKLGAINFTVPQKFRRYADILIDNIEGGYYNPEWHYTAAMGKSGETMFGMDRVHGKKIFDNEYGEEFWSLIDANKNKETWKHLYKAKDLPIEPILRQLAAQLMYNQFVTLSDKYLKKNKSIIENDDCLALHFYYACWNGSGWFQKFAKTINAEIKRQNGQNDINLLRVCALNSRINSGNKLIKRGGEKMQKIWKTYFNADVELLPELVKQVAKPSSNAWIWWLLGGAVVIGGGVGIYLYKRKKK